VIGEVAERDVLDTLLLNVVQSAAARQPAWEPEAVWQPKEPVVPIWVNEPVSGEDAVRVEVAVPKTPAPPPDSRTWPAVRLEVVANPAHENVTFAEVTVRMIGETATKEVVAKPEPPPAALIVQLEPPKVEPGVPVQVIPEPQVTVEVAI
jgi:hypothetical protein